MHIRKLELQGFKSFPERTTFHFADGISGVVGPNGCGKSNVVDAVKWCLGEQSARSLRGQAMQDVIFAGSEDRLPVGLAEVRLTFSASETPFPGEFSRYEEIQVSRRLYRDGQSEYLINQNRVRLKDIQELFMDSGAANRLYSFIEQGRIGEIVNARPEQRRGLIEEAAGISRYKARRKEAQARLTGTLQNLERVTTLVEDMGSRLRSLERQVGRAMRYRRLRSFVRQAEIYLGLARFGGLVGDRKVLAESLRELEVREVAARRDVSRAEERIRNSRTELVELEGVVGRIRDELAELEATRRERESARQYQDKERASLLERQLRIGERVAELRTSVLAADERLNRATSDRKAAEEALASADEVLSGHRVTVDHLAKLVQDRRARIEECKQGILERVKTSAASEARVQAAAQRTKDLEARLERIGGRRSRAAEDLQASLKALEASHEHFETSFNEANQASRAVDSARLRVEEDRTRTAGSRINLRKAEREFADLTASCGADRARLESLEAMLKAHEGIEEDLRPIMAMDGVHGTLAEHLDVSVSLEKGLVAALGPALDSVLVDDESTAVRVANKVEGRIGILILSSAPEGCTGFAERVGGTPLGSAALSLLLGDCGEAENLNDALRIYREEGRACVVSGEQEHAFVDSRGLVFVGMPRGGGTAILARRRQVAELRSRLVERTVELDGARERVEGCQQEVVNSVERQTDSEQHLSTVSTESAAKHLGRQEASRRRQRIGQECDRLRGLEGTIHGEFCEVERSLAELAKEVVERKESDRVAQAERIELEKELEVERDGLNGEEEKLESERQVLQAKASEVSGLRERLMGLRRSESEVGELRDGASSQIETLETERLTARARIEHLVADELRLSGLLEKIGTGQSDLGNRLSTEQERLVAERSAVAEKEQELRAALSSREEVTAERLEIERRIARTREDIGRIRQQLDDRYQVSVAGMMDKMDRTGHVTIAVDPSAIRADLPDCARPTPKDEQLITELRVEPQMLEDESMVSSWVSRLQKAREEFERLGEVNLVALREYTEVSDRHDALDEQRKDLEDSVQSIRHTIGRLNRISRERFRETFDAVDGYFREIYPRLVGGGSARLELTDEEDLLETGVDIFVQPPGKRLQNLSLLSGGETAMVAIALIFSLFRVKPSPFCLLDEVDAPLDEGNGARFNSMLREMARLSQFIVITHNKKTMECVDTLYGVTMPVPGVSRLVSVQLD